MTSNARPASGKMKNLIFISFLVYTLFSCARDHEFDFDSDQYPQKWQLISMTGQTPDSETTGADMQWQEFYRLNSNWTFTKSRERDGVLTEAAGTFIFSDSPDGKVLDLSYESDNAIIGSCYNEPSESLRLESENKLAGTWSYCDGPGLVYERTE